MKISFVDWLKKENYILWYKQEPLYLKNAEDFTTLELIVEFLKLNKVEIETNLENLVKNKSLTQEYSIGYLEGFNEAITKIFNNHS